MSATSSCGCGSSRPAAGSNNEVCRSSPLSLPCRATTKASTHSWCTEYCNTPGSYCDPVYCDCSDGGTGLEDTEAFKVPETFNVSAPIQPHDPNISACTPHEARTISACSGLGI